MTRRYWITLLLGFTCLVACASAQDAYPSKPIRLLVPFAPGGAADAVARILSKPLGEQLGQPIVIENRGGAGGNIGAGAAARAAPDGYTLLLGSSANLAINPTLYKSLPFDPVKSFAPVSLVVEAPHVIVVSADSPVDSVADLIRQAKAAKQPLAYGSGGVGTPTHLAGQLFATRAAVEMRHIPYKGSGPALVDLMAQRLNVQIDSLPAVIGPIQGGKLKALAQTGKDRLPILPKVPTAAEAGLADFEVIGWFGVLAPAGTPPAVVERLNSAIRAALSEPETRAQFDRQGARTTANSPTEFAGYIRTDIDKWAAVVKSASIQLD